MYNLEYFQKLAKLKKGVCLSREYFNIKTHLHWKCEKNHIWKAIPEVIKRGSWCPECAGSNHKLKSKSGQIKYTKEIAKIIKNKNGFLLLPKVIESSTQPIFIKCEAHGKFKTTANLVKDGAWCIKCGFIQTANKRRIPYEKVVALIKKKKATLHTSEKEYHENKGKVSITCSNDHTWSPLSRDIISRKFWCAKCAQAKNAAEKRLDIRILQKVAKERGGRLISKAYINTTTPLEWECIVKHRWSAVAGSILGTKNINGTWCPSCKHTSRSEMICRIYLEEMFQKKFIKSRPEWLKGAKGVSLELDGYCEELKLAFEHQGSQHYDNPRYFPNSAEGIKERDKLKRKACKKRGIYLIEVPELNSRLPFGQLEKFLLNEIKSAGLSKKLKPYKLSPKIFLNAWAPRHNEKLIEAHAIAKLYSGKCLSTIYLNSRMRLDWECDKGHRWKEIFSKVNSGKWCSKCERAKKISEGWKVIRKPKYSIVDMQKIAESRSGKCLSTEYINSDTKLLWQCQVGHEWSATPDNIKSGKWCRICRVKESANRRKATIEDMQKIALSRKGKCLSTEYINSQTPLLWECQNGHQWEAQPNNVKLGTWCRKCSSGNQWGKNKKF